MRETVKIRKSTKVLAAATLTVAAAGAAVLAVTIPGSASPATGCPGLSQPVYSNNGNVLIGTWNASLPLGDEVFLPDGDVATCTRAGLDVEQP